MIQIFENAEGNLAPVKTRRRTRGSERGHEISNLSDYYSHAPHVGREHLRHECAPAFSETPPCLPDGGGVFLPPLRPGCHAIHQAKVFLTVWHPTRRRESKHEVLGLEPVSLGNCPVSCGLPTERSKPSCSGQRLQRRHKFHSV